MSGNQRTFAEGHFCIQVVAVMADTQPYASVPVSVLFDKSLSREARLLYVAIWWWEFDDQRPTQDEMAEELGASRATIWRAISELQNAGLIEQERIEYGKPNVVRPLAGPARRRKRTRPPVRTELRSASEAERMWYEERRGPRIPKDWSARIRRRDGKCVICGTTERLCAHHIVPVAEDPKLQADENNGITLCHKCHASMRSRKASAEWAPIFWDLIAEGVVTATGTEPERRFTLTKESA